MIGKFTTTNVFFSFVSPVLPFHYSPLVVPHHGRVWPIYKLSVRWNPCASQSLSYYFCGCMWVLRSSRVLQQPGAGQGRGPTSGDEFFCSDLLGFTLLLRLRCLHVPVNASYVSVNRCAGIELCADKINHFTPFGGGCHWKEKVQPIGKQAGCVL